MFKQNPKLLPIVIFLLFFLGQQFLIAQSVLGDVSKVDNFTLSDYEGNKHQLTDYAEYDAIIIIFISTQCPVSNAYNSRMEKIFQDYKNKNVAFLGINSNKEEDIKSIEAHAKKNGFFFTILKDEKNIIADKFRASFTPEVYMLNSLFEILYHGRIDNSRDESSVDIKDLRKALDEILTGKPVSNPNTKAFGCTIKRV